jgi:hypothetical protein
MGAGIAGQYGPRSRFTFTFLFRAPDSSRQNEFKSAVRRLQRLKNVDVKMLRPFAACSVVHFQLESIFVVRSHSGAIEGDESRRRQTLLEIGCFEHRMLV